MATALRIGTTGTQLIFDSTIPGPLGTGGLRAVSDTVHDDILKRLQIHLTVTFKLHQRKIDSVTG